MPLDRIKNLLVVDTRIVTAGQPTESQLSDVAAAGCRAVVNLGLHDARYCLPEEASCAAALGLDYRHIPVRFEAPAVEDFDAFVAVMDELAGERVFVHCASNYRVSCFLALYGEMRLGWTSDEADQHIRRVWTPNQTWLAFVTAMRLKWADAREATGSASLPTRRNVA